MRTAKLVTFLIVPACAGPGDRSMSTQALPTGVSQGDDDDDGGASSSDTGPAGSSTGDDEGPVIKLDVGAAGSGGITVGETNDRSGCEKVDFLFVIDNSGSMGDNQNSLIASFPGFMEAILNTLDEAQDYHVMVTDSDALWGGECALLCDLFFGICPDLPPYPCADGPPSECDTTLGAGVNFTMASDAPNVPCTFSSGGRYMDTTEPDLHAAFQCAAKVGSDGSSDERMMSSMVSALSYDLGQPGGCNEGFVREDAILVVTLITDEEDVDSTGFPEGWHANVVSSKGGDETAIVMLGLINDMDAPAPLCPPESQDPVRLRTFIDMFPNSIRASVCEASYAGFFEQAVALIDTTCDEFEPPAG
jgi:hypothetical protein